MAPANFKTYESQARLLRAIVAAHSDVKWNYKDIQKFYGSDMTKDALNHRFRALRNQGYVLREADEQGVDCKAIPVDLPKEKKGNHRLCFYIDFLAFTHHKIAKFFGESTADGIQFQFRGIKKDAESLKQTANSGGNPASVLTFTGGTGSNVSTPRKPRTPSGAKVRASGGGRSTTAKKTIPIKTDPMSDDDEEGSDAVDYNALEDTPSKTRVHNVLDGRVTKNRATPRRSATPSRAATIAAAAVDLTTSDSEVDTPNNASGYELPPIAEAKPAAVQRPSFEEAVTQHQTIIQPNAMASFTGNDSFSQSMDAAIFNPINNMNDELNFSFAESMVNSNGGYDSSFMGADGEI
ncbi:hypothetical protein JMJ77_0005195 [Colletotrichum scovillei]|uniref:Uncharacterized protein n=1 Tax=Colletotrichum scovillei TaxID=1209932 RepID=A0A9P7RG11_9PEZI|nr:hypothetical protein JMJ77_0005195 [Colletotrichum scovillei]KAG7076410.1 hypothetical protein JMJ76_0013675 [Colletotrichum scovillei]KAG7083520.1 hypothetical protein JMJ78_0008965 [Colletotrichum scovillei]